MRLSISVDEAELVQLVEQLAPIRIYFGNEDQEQWVHLTSPERLGLIGGQGFRVETRGVLKLAVAGFPLSIDIDHLQLLIEPRIDVLGEGEASSAVLVFDIQVEQGDLHRIPSIIEKAILKGVNSKLIPENTKTLWRFPETLTQEFAMPKLLQPLESFVIESRGAEVDVTNDLLTFSVRVDTGLRRFSDSTVVE